MKVTVTGQIVEIVENELLVSGTIGVNIIEFTFDSSWDDYVKKAVFESAAGEIYMVELIDNACVIPNEALESPGYLKIGCYGVNIIKVRPTVFAVAQVVYQGANIN